MIRTQVSFGTNKSMPLLSEEAKALGISLAEFVRRAVRDRLPIAQQSPWMREEVESGDPNSSASIDEIVYGSKD